MKLLSNTADGVFAIDSECRFILWNKAAQEILGYTPDEVLGKFCYEVLPGRDVAGNLFCFRGCSVMKMAKQGQAIRNYDIQWITKANRKIWINVSTLQVTEAKQQGPIIIHLFRPIPSPRRMQDFGEHVTYAVLNALGHALPRAVDISSSVRISSLTRREAEILLLMAQCRGTKEIADRLCISYATVRTHIQNILEKLQVHSKLEAVALAFQLNLLKTRSFSHSQPFLLPLQLQQLHD